MGDGDIARRSVLRAGLHGSVAVMAGGLLVTQARAQSEDKMTKARAEYQAMPNGIYSCATCTLFVAPNACKVVDGEVSPDGWCRAYAMAD
jgi:High potential iron-sulfur protein